jgi:hypothetical protein
MFRKLLVPALTAATLLATPALAEDVIYRVLAWLRDQGFTEFEVERTWLGRTKIEAEADGVEREIIINPRTGEILRDYWEIDDAEKAEAFLAFINPLATVKDETGKRESSYFEYRDRKAREEDHDEFDDDEDDDRDEGDDDDDDREEDDDDD